MRGAASKKPTLPVCHLCGQQFGTASLAIHQKACKEKYERERGRAAPEAPMLASSRENQPIKPGGRAMTQREIDEFNDQAYTAWADDLEPCPHCKRRYAC